MAFSATVANILPKEQLEDTLKLYTPLLDLSFIIVIVNLGMPLDYRLIAGAGIFTAIYIIAGAAGKIGGAFPGGKLRIEETQSEGFAKGKEYAMQ